MALWSLHGFVTRILTSAEVTDALVFAVATLVIWPQLPDRYLGPSRRSTPQHLVPGHSRDGARGMRARRDTGARRSLRVADRRPYVRLRFEHGDDRLHGGAHAGPGEQRTAVAGAASRLSRLHSAMLL